MTIQILVILLVSPSLQTLLKYTLHNNNNQSLEDLTQNSIYQCFAFIHPTDSATSTAASQDTGPVGAYARSLLQLRQKFHSSARLKTILKHLFEQPVGYGPLGELMADAQDKLLQRIMLLTAPGPSRSALIRYAVRRRQGGDLSALQREMQMDPDFEAVMKDPNQPFLRDKRFARVLQMFEQDMIDAAVKACRHLGAHELEQDYTRLAFAQLDAQISLYQQQQHQSNDYRSDSRQPTTVTL